MILFPRLRRRVTRLLLLLALPVVVCAHEGPLPVSLKGVPVPDGLKWPLRSHVSYQWDSIAWGW